MLDNPYFGVFMAQGTGKTRVVLETFAKLQHRVLVLAPVVTLNHVWAKEIEKWGFDFSYHILHGKGIKDVPHNRDFYIASNDIVRIPKKNTFKFNALKDLILDLNIEALIVDESGKYANHSSCRTKRLMHFARICTFQKNILIQSKPRFKRVYILSGTPQPNDITNLWSQIFLLDGGKRLSKMWTWFLRKYNIQAPRMYQPMVIPPQAVTQVWDDISDICISVVTPFAPATHIQHVCSLKPAEHKQYRKLIVEKEITVGNKNIVCQTIGALLAKIRQLSGGFVYIEGKPYTFSTEKIKWTLDFIEQQQGNQTIIAYTFNYECNMLKEALSKKYRIAIICGRTRKEEQLRIIHKWQNRKLDVILANPQRAAFGLDGLQHTCNHILWYSLPLGNFALYDQFNSRVDRMGQTKQVFIHHIFADKTYDKTAHETIIKKQKLHQTFMEYQARA